MLGMLFLIDLVVVDPRLLLPLVVYQKRSIEGSNIFHNEMRPSG